MEKSKMKDLILEAKQAKGMSWEQIAEAVGLSSEYVVSACLGMNHLEGLRAMAGETAPRQTAKAVIYIPSHGLEILPASPA